MSICKELPDWFHAENYDVLKDFGAEDWVAVLRAMDIHEFRRRLKPEHAFEMWNMFGLGRSDLVNTLHMPGLNIPMAGVSSAVTEFDPREKMFLPRLLTNLKLHTIEPFTFLRVDLRCPDDALIPAIEDAMRKAREKYPSPGSYSGRPKKFCKKIHEKDFSNWAKYKVVGIFDLLFWSTYQGRTISNLEIAEVLFPELYNNEDKHDQLSKHVSYAKKRYNEARNALIPLALQVLTEKEVKNLP